MMLTRQIVRFLHFLLIVCCLLGFSPSFAQVAPPPRLPSGTTPGGARPQIKEPQKKIPLTQKLELSKDSEIPDDLLRQRKKFEDDPRMQISAFVLEGAVDRPDEGIYVKDIEKQIETFRLATTAGFTIGDLRNLAAQLTLTYRQAGFFLARVYIPEQDVTDGMVRIKVIEGYLDKIIVEGNNRYPKKMLARPFSDQVNKPVYKERLEDVLLLLNDYPGLQSSSVLSAGESTGATELILKVEKEIPYEGIVSLDNYGTDLTGKFRVHVGFTINNPSRRADRLSARIGTGFVGGGDNTFFSLGYDRPVMNFKYLAGLGLSNNGYNVGDDFEKLNIKGKSTMINAYLLKSFIRLRNKSVTGRIDLSHKKASSTLSGRSFSDDSLIVLNLNGTLAFRDARWAGDNHVGLQVTYGEADTDRIGGSGATADGGFIKAFLNASRLQPIDFKHPFFRNHFLMLRFQYQYTPDLLSSLEQFSLGGPNSVRAYPISENLTDQGLFFSVEWIAKATRAAKDIFLEDLQFSFFMDHANGRLKDALLSEKSSASLTGLGAAMQFSPYGKYTARFDLAFPLGGPEPSNGGGIQFFFRLGYLF